MPVGNGLLESWKQIADFLGCSERTAQRYMDRGLPVHHVGGGKLRRVYARADELAAWVRSGDGAGDAEGTPENAPHGAPAAGATPFAFYLEITRGQSVGATFPLQKPMVVIGRELGCQITVAEPSVSRRHARIVPGPDGLTVEDLASKNGTFVNGRRIGAPRPLSEGDRLKLGKTLEFTLKSAQAADTV